jgi:hypothetical protein
VFIPEKTDILFVTNTSRDISFLNLALTADERSQSSYAIETIAPSKLLMTSLSHFDVIIISNVKSFSSDESERLKQFAMEGGAIILFPGADVDVPQYAAEFCRRLNIAPFIGKVGSVTDRRMFLTFEGIDFAHPIFSGMFEGKPFAKKSAGPSVESPQISVTLEYRPGANGQSIIRLSNGTSFLTDYKIGDGRLLLYSVAPTPDWSDFPLKGIFVPLIRRSISYLASWNQQVAEHLAGTAATLTVPLKAFVRSQTSPVHHRSPDGWEEVVQPRTAEKSGERVFVIKRTEVPGIHEVIHENQLISAFAVNLDPRESDLRKLNVDEVKRWLTTYGFRPDAIRILGSTERPEAVVLQSRFGIELWKYFLGLAFACALTEMIVSRGKREESERHEK